MMTHRSSEERQVDTKKTETETTDGFGTLLISLLFVHLKLRINSSVCRITKRKKVTSPACSVRCFKLNMEVNYSYITLQAV